MAFVSPFHLSRDRLENDPAALRWLDDQGLLSLWARKQGIAPSAEESPLADRIRRRRRENAARREMLLSRAAPLIERWTTEGLSTIAVKGLDLAGWLWPDPSDRGMIDLDFWFPERPIDALRIALDSGWSVDEPYRDVPEGTFGQRHEICILSSDGSASIDIHRNLVPDGRFSLPEQEMARDARPAPHLLGRALAPSIEEHLLFLAAHMAGHHGWESLSRSWEIGEIWRRLVPEARGRVRIEAGAAGCSRSLDVQLELARRHAEVDIEAIAPGRAVRLWISLAERAYARGLAGLDPAGRLRKLEVLAISDDSAARTAGYLVRRLVGR